MRFAGVAAAALGAAKVSRKGSAIIEPPILRKERRVVELV